jgi:hypothetical protein
MNRWSFLTVLVVVAGAVAGFGIYAFGWREDNDGSNERARAMLYAQEVGQWVENGCGEEDCDVDEAVVLRIEPVADGLWRARLRFAPSTNVRCVAIDLEHFRMASNGTTFHGAARVECPGGD